MATIRAKVTIHLTTIGDVTIDQLAVCSENPRALAEIRNVVCIPQVEVVVEHPGVTVEYYVAGLMFIPDPSNTNYFTLRNQPTDTGLLLHAYNPSFISLQAYPFPIRVFYNAPLGSPNTILRIIWV